MEIEEKLNNSINSKVKSDKHRLALYVEKLKGLSPLEKLNQGYSFTEKEDGTVVNDVSRVKEGDMLKVYVRNGLIEAKVTDISIYEE